MRKTLYTSLLAVLLMANTGQAAALKRTAANNTMFKNMYNSPYYTNFSLGTHNSTGATLSRNGIDIGDWQLDDAVGPSIAVGQRFAKFYRGELEILSYSHDYKNSAGSIDKVAFMLNGVYDFNIPRTAFSLYSGVGIGFMEIEDSDGDFSDNVFAYQVKLGGNYRINPNYHLNLGYRYMDNSDVRYEVGADAYEFTMPTKTFEIGLTINF